VGLYTEQFYAIIPTLFLHICYPYMSLHFNVFSLVCTKTRQYLTACTCTCLYSPLHNFALMFHHAGAVLPHVIPNPISLKCL